MNYPKNLINSKKATAVATVLMMLGSLAPEASYGQTTCPPPLPNVPRANAISNFLDSPRNQAQANVFLNLDLRSVRDTVPNVNIGFYRGAIKNFANSIVTTNGTVVNTINISPGNLRVTRLPGNPRTFKSNFLGLEIGYNDINESGDFNNGGLRLDISFEGIPVELTLFVPSTSPNLINSLSASALRRFEIPGVLTGIGDSPELFGLRGFPRSSAFSFRTNE